MGKASRTKRERREDESSLPKIDVPRERRELPVFWIVIGLLVVAGIAALVLTAPDDATKEREAAVADAPTYADVTVDGGSLTSWDGRGTDPGVGEDVPTLRGTSMEGEPLTVRPGGGTAKVYVVMAHWCPHCQAEIPRIVEWSKENELPAGVEVVGVSTSADEGQANFPPATWLAREDWPYDVLIDDELGTASDALGVEGFPYMVFVNPDGTVDKRFSGEMEIEDFAAAIDDIAPESEAAGNGADAPADA